RIIACPGCYPTAALLALLPLVKASVIATDNIILNAISGVSGAGRALKQNTLFCEAGEGFSPYAIGSHRHTPEIEQELSRAADKSGSDTIGIGEIEITFTPHLVPMSRGELITCYLTLKEGTSHDDARAAMQKACEGEPFVHLVPKGVTPGTQHVRGSNHCLIGMFKGKVKNQLIVV
ncbi:unnamed protein product, partial [Scytosiphon promiscuus]